MKHLIWLTAVLMTGCATAPQPSTTTPAAVQHEGNRIRFAADSPQLVKFRLAAVEEALVPAGELVAPGRIELNPGRVARVLLPAPGRVQEVLVRLGDRVQAGQAVLTLESPEVGAILSAMRQAEAQKRQAAAGIAKAEADLDRVRDLFANRAIAQKEVLAAETVLQQARAELDVAEASREEALRRLDLLGLKAGNMQQRIRVPAPVSGKVMEVSVTPGEFRADPAAQALVIADTSTVWIAADVPEDQLRAVAIGDKVAVEMVAFPDQVFEARVMRMADAMDAQTRTVKVRAELRNADGQLRSEMYGTVRTSHGTRKELVVPREALYQQPGKTSVFRSPEKGVFELVEVQVVWQDRARAAVRGALAAGEQVVVDGVTQLRAY